MTIAGAIRRLESMATELTGACVEAQSDKVSAYIARKIEAVDMAIAALKEQDVTDINVGNKWRNFETEKPKHGQEVLGINSDGEMETYYFDAEWPVCLCKYGGNLKTFNITHWMPLPEPPKEDAE